jgi:hypothetical protein
MAMPKTSVNEDYFPAGAENNIGSARQVFLVQSITIAFRVQQPANAHLNRRILAFHRLHGPSSDGWRFH